MVGTAKSTIEIESKPGAGDWEEIEVDLEFEYEPYEAPNYWGPNPHPGSEAEITITSVVYKGTDMTGKLERSDWDRLEAACWDQMESDNEYDGGGLDGYDDL